MYTIKFFLMASCCLAIGLYAGFHAGERKSATDYQRAAIDHGYAYHSPIDGSWSWVDLTKVKDVRNKSNGIFVNNQIYSCIMLDLTKNN